MSWILVIVLGGLIGGVSDVKIEQGLSEPQCRQFIDQVRPLRGRMGAGCFGPNGEYYGVDSDG